MRSDDLLDRLETFYDAVPRPRTDPEQIGPFTLFVPRAGWGYYARPRIGETTPATVADVDRVRERQRELGLPEQFEWVDEVTPGLDAVLAAAGVAVQRCPLMVLDGPPRGDAGACRLIDPYDEELMAQSRAAVSVGFAHEGTDRGDAGIEARDAMHGDKHAVIDDAFRTSVREGQFILAVAFAADDPQAGAVGGGSVMPVGEVAEIAGVGVLPAYRRRGLAAQLTHLLASEAIRRGVRTVFCAADSEDVARVYGGVGFRRVGTACIAAV